MYRFYAEVAGAKISEVDYPQPAMEFPLQEVLDAITPETRAVLLANPEQSHRAPASAARHRAHSEARAQGRRA